MVAEVSWSSDSSRIPREVRVRNRLIRSMDTDGATPSMFLDLLDEVTAGGMWRKMPDRRGRAFRKFIDFVTAERPEGLGLHGKDDLTKHLALQHKEEREPYLRTVTVAQMAEMRKRVQSLLYEETEPQQDNGGDRRSGEFQSGGTRLNSRENNSEYIVARLKRDAEHDPVAAEWAAKVISGEKTPNAAALKMGWRKPRIMVTTPKAVADALRDYMSPEDLAELVRILSAP